MSVNTLKCVNCNIVISEVLAFIRNKQDVMDNESLINICHSAFSEEEIDKAKKLLFTSTKTNQKLVSRRKQKKMKDLEDIIAVFKTIDPNHIPVFVAYDLHKLPPVCFDHVDVTKLLKDLLILRAEVAEIKNNYVTTDQLETAKEELNQLNNPISLFNPNVNMRRGGYIMNSGPIGLAPHNVSQSSSNGDRITMPIAGARPEMSHEGDSKASMYRSLSICSDDSHNHVNRVASIDDSISTVLDTVALPTDKTTTESNKNVDNEQIPITMADIVNKGEWKSIKPEEKWILVQKHKTRNRFSGQPGKAVSSPSGKFKAADSLIPLFISNVSKETTEKDIYEYIERKTKERVKLEKINMKLDKPYNAFKVYVSKYKLNTYLDNSLWPEGITFRRFIFFKKTGEDGGRAPFMNENNTQCNV